MPAASPPSFAVRPSRSDDFDGIVVGGSLGGLLTAAHLGKQGRRVLLLEKHGYLGGALTAGLLPCLPEMVEPPIPFLAGIRRKLTTARAIDEDGRLHVEYLKIVLEEFALQCDNVQLRYHTDILIPEYDRHRLRSLITHCKSGTHRLNADIFIDASQNFDLARLLAPETPGRLVYSGRVRVGGCTHVPAEAAIIPSFNNLSVYLGDQAVKAQAAERVVKKFQRGIELDPFDEGLPPQVADILGGRVRIRRAHYSRDRLLEFSFVSAPGQDVRTKFRDLAWKILRFWKETLPGFEDAYLCFSAPELDKIGLALPERQSNPRFLTGKGRAYQQEYQLLEEGRFASFEEAPVSVRPSPFAFRAKQWGNVWLPGDSRYVFPDRRLRQVVFPGLSAAWASAVAEEASAVRQARSPKPRSRPSAKPRIQDGGKPDIVVVGGGPSGVAAAVAASRHGAKVTLIEKSYDLGGNGTTGGVTSFAGGARGGLYEELLQQLHGEKHKFPHNQAFDPEGYRWVLDRLLKEHQVEVVLAGALIQAHCPDQRIEHVIVRHEDRFRKFSAHLFIDASGDAELCHLAGVPTVVGRDSDGKTQPVTLMYQIAHEGSERHLNLFWRIPHGRFLVNATRIAALGIDSRDLTRAEIEGRRQMNLQAKALSEQFGYRLVHSGPRVGVRETRRIVGHYTLTVEDARSGRHFDDAIGKCNYFLDIHNPNGTTGTYAENVPVYEIPFRSLIPRGIDNLLAAGRCISMTHEAMASLRVMPPCYVIGQAAGTAAALCLHSGACPATLNIRMLRSTLSNDGVDLER